MVDVISASLRLVSATSGRELRRAKRESVREACSFVSGPRPAVLRGCLQPGGRWGLALLGPACQWGSAWNRVCVEQGVRGQPRPGAVESRTWEQRLLKDRPCRQREWNVPAMVFLFTCLKQVAQF